MMAAKDSSVDYAKIFLPHYCPEIVPSRRTRESNNSILQSHNRLNTRNSDGVRHSSSSDNLRKFDYARLDFSPPSPRNLLLPRNNREDYVNLKEEEEIGGAARMRRHSACYVNLRERDDTGAGPQVRPRSDCYVNLRERDDTGAGPQVRPRSDCYVNLRERDDTGAAPQVRPRSDCYVDQEVDEFCGGAQLHPSSNGYVNVGANRQSDIHFARKPRVRIETMPPRPAHLAPRWKSERTRRRSAESSHHDYQNVRPTSSNQSQEELSTAAGHVAPRRSSSMVPERNPTTGEYQNLLQEDGRRSGTSSPAPVLLTPDPYQSLSKGPRRHHSQLQSPLPVQHSCKVTRSVSMRHGGAGHTSRSPVPPFTSRKVDYENLWYLVPDPRPPGVEDYYSEDKGCSSDEEQSLQEKKAMWRSSTGSLAPDYYDHLSPRIVSSGLIAQKYSHSTLRLNYDWESEVEDRSDGLSITSSRNSPEYVSRAEVGLKLSVPRALETQDVVPGSFNRRSHREGSVASGCEEGNHLGRFKLRYMGQCPIDRFLGPIDVCVRDILKSSLQSTKDVHADVSLTGIKLTPPDSDLLFAAFGTEHTLSVGACAKNKRVVGIIFKRSRGRCVCHLFRCRDDATPRIFISTVNTALVSISKSAMRKLKERAVEIEKSSVIPTDLFGSVRYLGCQFIAPQQLITDGIAEALKENMKPSALTDVTLTLHAHTVPDKGLFVVHENAGQEPILTSPIAEIDMVGCNVLDRRYVGVRLLDKKQGLPTIHIFHFGQAFGAAAFLAVMRDKFGVAVDEGELSSPSQQPTWKALVSNDLQPASVSGTPSMASDMRTHKGRGICRKLTFKDFICSSGHRHS